VVKALNSELLTDQELQVQRRSKKSVKKYNINIKGSGGNCRYVYILLEIGVWGED
jgi:hypothetical protein